MTNAVNPLKTLGEILNPQRLASSLGRNPSRFCLAFDEFVNWIMIEHAHASSLD